MKAIENRHYRSLELDKILEMLASHATCADAKSLALSLTPQTDLYLAQALLKQTEDAHMLLARFGGPAFGGLHNVNNALQRAAAGGMLTMRELLEIAEVLRVIRSLSEWRSRSEGVETCLDNFFHALMPNKFLEERILNAILSEDEMANGASPTLQDIRRKIRAASSRVRDRLDQMIRSPRYQNFCRSPLSPSATGGLSFRLKMKIAARFRASCTIPPPAAPLFLLSRWAWWRPIMKSKCSKARSAMRLTASSRSCPPKRAPLQIPSRQAMNARWSSTLFCQGAACL